MKRDGRRFVSKLGQRRRARKGDLEFAGDDCDFQFHVGTPEGGWSPDQEIEQLRWENIQMLPPGSLP